MLAVALFAATPVAAQTEALIEALAPVLAAEDARRFDAAALQRAAGSPDSVVRRLTAMAVGRIGDPRGVPLLLTLYADPDSTVRPAAAFALGLLRDTSAVAPIIARLGQPPALDAETVAESITALARIGGARAGEWMGGVLERRVPLLVPDTLAAVQTIVGEAWRLGDAAPVTALLPFLRDTSLVARGAAVYTLGRLRAPAASSGIIAALSDRDAGIRAAAARALTRTYAEAAELAPATTAGLLLRLTDDRTTDVRIAALR
ncbi:MAG: HEAT repeat domain-containing protein, partial [Gemmatimonadota bacterium]|nr:HEAT repeat domain-containing protein [Gemmatimonadota bacterium]